MLNKIKDFRKILIFKSPPINNLISILFLASCLILACFINFQSRFIEKEVWADNKELFYVNGVPSTRSGDPGFFLGIAKTIKQGLDHTEFTMKKRQFPKGKDTSYGIPLLSKLIAFISVDSSVKSLVDAGNLLIFISALLTPIAIFFLFLVIGRPFEGVVSSFGSGIMGLFFFRSGYGYIDTDMLNLFSFYLLFAFIILASKKQGLHLTIIFSTCAGITAKFFYEWYQTKELIYMGFLSLVFLSLINIKNFKKIILIIGIFMIITGPSVFYGAIDTVLNNQYLKLFFGLNVPFDNTNLSFNGIYQFIQELQKPSFMGVLRAYGPLPLSILCLIGLSIWGIAQPTKFIGLAPLSLFFTLSILLGQRALFYSVPFFLFGGAYLFNFLTFKILYKINIVFRPQYIFFITSLLLVCFLSYFLKPFSKPVSSTFIMNDILESFVEIKKISNDKKQSVIATDWSYGYQAMFLSDLPTLLDGGSADSPRHYFMSRAIMAPSLDETHSTLKYISSGHVENLNKKGINSFNSLARDVFDSKKSDVDIYFVLTGLMQKFFHSYAYNAYWDIENNKPIKFNEITADKILKMSSLDCEKLDPVTLKTICVEEGSEDIKQEYDLSKGLIDGEPSLSRVVQVRNNKVVTDEKYENSHGKLVFQIINRENETNVYLMHEAVYNSSYNRLMHLNINDGFDLVIDNYPYVRVFKLK